MPQPASDPVADLLKKTPTTPSQRADLWDAFQAATSTDDLATRLKPLTVPDSVKADLWDLKAKAERPPDFRTTNKPPSPSLWGQANTPLIPHIANAAHAIADYLDSPKLD